MITRASSDAAETPSQVLPGLAPPWFPWKHRAKAGQLHKRLPTSNVSRPQEIPDPERLPTPKASRLPAVALHQGLSEAGTAKCLPTPKARPQKPNPKASRLPAVALPGLTKAGTPESDAILRRHPGWP